MVMFIHYFFADNHADYLIIGGGIMGQALAYNLWRTLENITLVKAKKGYSVTIAVCEKDPSVIYILYNTYASSMCMFHNMY